MMNGSVDGGKGRLRAGAWGRVWERALCSLLLACFALGCRREVPARAVTNPQPGVAVAARTPVPANAPDQATAPGEFRGFDRNDFPGDDAMARMRRAQPGFAFTGFWITSPPGEQSNTWAGKRALLRAQGWGFLVLANGRLDAEILKAAKTGIKPEDLGREDARYAVAQAQAEGFPSHAILFLDQEEGGRLLAEQAAYLLAWTEAVAASGFRPGVYASGQQVEDSPGAKIDTIEDIRGRITAGKMREVAIFDALDQCPPAPGCTMQAKPLSAAPDKGLVAWQYAQSPRRPEITRSCGSTYASDGNCYAPGFPGIFLDLEVANSPDPSQGR